VETNRQAAHLRDWAWVAVQFALLGAILYAPRIRQGQWYAASRRVGRVVGGAAALAGALLVALSARDLGSNLTPNPRPKTNNALVEHGVYGLVRHPMYSGVLLLALGWSLLRASTLALLLSGLLGLFFDAKARREEHYLAARHGGYAAYRRRVRRLLPWVY
jgi:protein-S-isoprenylcysteine O-methyltransferase Ste14